MAENDNHHAGCRELLLRKFSEHGIDGLSETEMLEMLLLLIMPRCDAGSVANSLIKEFGSLKTVLFASNYELKRVEGVGDNTAHQLRFVGDIANCLIQTQPLENKDLKDFNSITEYCIDHFKDKSSEELTLLLFDDEYSLLNVHNITDNRPNCITVGNRDIVRLIMQYKCRKVIIAHNHPTGTAEPSCKDLKRTRELGEYLKIIGVELVDHIIVCKDKALSLRESGYLKKIGRK